MSEQLLPASLQSWMSEMDRRVRVMETTARVGISGIAWSKAVAVTNPATYDVFQAGTGLDTWIDSANGTGTGYPRATATIGSSGRALIFVSGAPSNVVNLPANYKTFDMLIGFGIDGAIPVGSQLREYRNSNTAAIIGPTMFVEPVAVTPGPHQFKVWLYFASGGGVSFLPYFDNSAIVVLPL